MKSLLAGLAAIMLLTSCSQRPPSRVAAAPSNPMTVHVVTVSTQSWPDVYEAPGTVKARVVATISSKVMGYVQQVGAKEGDHVTAGQLLIALEARDLDAAHRRAEIGRTEVQSSIPEADYAISAAKANLDLASVTAKRVEELAAKKSVTTQELDEASARLKAAQSNYEMARARRAQLDTRLAQAEQEIRSAAISRDYARISAPFAGTVTARTTDPGSLAVPGAPLLTIEQDGGYRLEAAVDESKIAAIRNGTPIEVAIDALDQRLNGHVSEIVPSVDAASRAYVVKIDLPVTQQLRTGMFGRACFSRQARSVISIPAASLLEHGQLQSVFVAENGVARTRMVTLGRRSGDSLEVLSGLASGETVIAPVPTSLRDGMEIRQ